MSHAVATCHSTSSGEFRGPRLIMSDSRFGATRRFEPLATRAIRRLGQPWREGGREGGREGEIIYERFATRRDSAPRPQRRLWRVPLRVVVGERSPPATAPPLASSPPSRRPTRTLIRVRRETPQLQHNTVTAQKSYFAFESSAFRSPSAPYESSSGGRTRRGPRLPCTVGRDGARVHGRT
jgi:hypothetical protein